MQPQYTLSILFKVAILYSFFNPIGWLVTLVSVWEILSYFIFFILAIIIGTMLVTVNNANKVTKEHKNKVDEQLNRFFDKRKHMGRYIHVIADSIMVYYSLVFADVSLVILFTLFIVLNLFLDELFIKMRQELNSK